MSQPQDAWAQLEAFDAPAQQAPQNAPQTPAQGETDAWAQLEQLDAQGPSATPAEAPKAADAETYRHNLRVMMADKAYSAADLNEFAKSQGYQIDPDSQTQLEERDRYIAENGKAPVYGVNVKQAQPAEAGPTTPDDGAFAAGLRGLGDTWTAGLLDEAGAVVDMLGGTAGRETIWNSDKPLLDLYQENRDQNRRILADDEKRHFGARLTGQIAGGILLPTSGARAGLGRLAAEGAGYGAAHGFGSGVGGVGDHLKSIASEATLGGVLGYGGGRAARALADLAPTAAAQQGRQVLDAAGRLSRDGLRVRPLPADVGGGITRGASGVGGQGIISGAIIDGAGNRYAQSVEQAAIRAADDLRPGAAASDSLNNVGAEVASDAGLGGFVGRMSDEADINYGRAEQLAGGARVSTGRTLQALDEQIARMERVPGGVAGIERMRTLRDDLAAGDFSIETLRDLRTSFGDQFDAGNRTARTAARQLWGPLSQDIDDGLRALGLDDAADAYGVADRAYAAGIDTRNNIVRPVVGRDGNLGSVQVANRLTSTLRNDPDRFIQTMAAMTPDQAGNARGAIVRDLGRPTNGAEDAFDVATFSRSWNKLSAAAQDAIAPTGTQARQDLDDVARLAQGVTEKNRWNNHSNSGRAVTGLRMLGQLGSGGTAVKSLGLSLLGEAVSGRALASNTLGRVGVRMGEMRPGSRSALASLSALPRQQSSISTLRGDEDEE
jgi:hypothetical protein